MDNGNGQIQQQVTGVNTTWPWGGEEVPAPYPANQLTETAPEPKIDRRGRYVRTEEWKQAVRAGWAKRRKRLAAAAATKSSLSEMDKAIAYHQGCLKTLLAAKALLK